jgi:hypothetical protein
MHKLLLPLAVCFCFPNVSIAQTNVFPSSGNVGIGTTNPISQLHLSSDVDHSFNLSRSNGTYGFRIYRDALGGNILFQIGITPTAWETKIKIGEGEGANTKLLLNPNGGNVGIGTSLPSEKLSVNGNVRAQKIIVTQTGWSDYVFEPTYQLRSLADVERFIKKNRRLPGIPSQKEVEEKGVSIGDSQAMLLKKIEELTLYVIELKKENDGLKQRIEKIERTK